MDKNVKSLCLCDLGYDKGVLKKTIENNVFTIFGNITKNNYVVLRYHGELIDSINYENYENNLYISYYFDGNEQEKRSVPLAKCTKCVGENYCTLISLEEHNSICFNFFVSSDANENISGKEETSFNLNIEKDPLTNILQKYGVEENNKLPVIEQKNEIQLKNFISNIKKFFLSLFKQKADTI